MPVVLRPRRDEKAEKAEQALKEVTRLQVHPGLTADERRDLVIQKLKLHKALDRYKRAGGAHGSPLVVATTTTADPGSAIIVLLAAAVAATGMALVGTNRQATRDLDSALRDMMEAVEKVDTSSGTTQAATTELGFGLSLAISSVATAKEAQAAVRAVDKKLDSCQQNNQDRLTSCKEALEKFAEARKEFRIALNRFVNDPLGQGGARLAKLRRIEQTRKLFLDALKALIECLGCTEFKAKK